MSDHRGVSVLNGGGKGVVIPMHQALTMESDFTSGRWRVLNCPDDAPAWMRDQAASHARNLRKPKTEPRAPLPDVVKGGVVMPLNTTRRCLIHIHPWPLAASGLLNFVYDMAEWESSFIDVHVIAKGGEAMDMPEGVTLHRPTSDNAAEAQLQSLNPTLVFHHGAVTKWLTDSIRCPVIGSEHSWSKSLEPSEPWVIPFAGPLAQFRRGVDLERWTPPKHRRRGKPFRVGIVGRLDHLKFPPDFLDALKAFQGVGNGVEFHIAGAPFPEHDTRIKDALESTTGVIVHGFIARPDMPAFYHGLNALLVPSSSESVGMQIIEAMACGVPVVGRNVAGIPDTIGKGGVVYDTDAELLDGVRKMAAMPSYQYSRLCKAARNHVVENHDIKDQFAFYRDAFSRLTKGAVKGPKTTKPRFQVFITTYNRPRRCLRLLEQIEEQRGDYEVSVSVYDDVTTADDAELIRFIKSHDWLSYHSAAKNRGRGEFWKTWSEIVQEAGRCDTDIYVSLQDDLTLCGGFFDAITRDIDKGAALHLMRDKRAKGPVWTQIKPKATDGGSMVGWVDCIFATRREFFELLNMEVLPPRRNPLRDNGDISSGVGREFSQRLTSQGKLFFIPKKSLVYHSDDGKSRMHSRLRGASVLKSDDFAGCQKVVANTASIPGRVDALRELAGQILAQVDHWNVYLNGYDSIPPFLRHKKITVARSQGHGDYGDAGKFFWSRDEIGYLLFIDDDVIIKSGAVQFLADRVDAYDRKAAVSIHGAIFHNHPMPNYFRAREVIRTVGEGEQDKRVHLIGTGLSMWYHTAIDFDFRSCPIPNMADMWFALAARSQGVPLYVAPRSPVCIERGADHETQKDCIWRAAVKDDSLHAAILNSAGKWGI